LAAVENILSPWSVIQKKEGERGEKKKKKDLLSADRKVEKRSLRAHAWKAARKGSAQKGKGEEKIMGSMPTD